MPDKPISYEKLTSGYKFPPTTYELTPSFVSRYLKAVEGSDAGFVPPLAMTACAIATMTKAVPLPPGTIAIHASQELEFLRLVPVGVTVECHIGVAQKIVRGKMSMLVLEIEIFDEGKEKVQSGRATVALPA